jgi:tripeptide aminopeptidase
VKFLLRDFELKGLADKGKILRGLCRGLQAGEPRARARCKTRKQYRNMAYWLRKDMRPVACLEDHTPFILDKTSTPFATNPCIRSASL